MMERTEERTKTHACDCISRQAAIEALKRDEALVRAFGYQHAIDAIQALPSAQPEWIPTKTRKPTKAGQYLVTKQQKTGELQRATAHYNPTFDEWSGNGNFGKVLAWMELPPVYKEEE